MSASFYLVQGWFRYTVDGVTPDEACRLTTAGLPEEVIPFTENLEDTPDFACLDGREPAEDKAVLLLAEIQSEKEQTVFASAGADFFMGIFCNGECCLSTLTNGSCGCPPTANDRVLQIPLKQGRNTLGFYVRSGSRGWKGGFRFLADSAENQRRLAFQKILNNAFPAPLELRYGPWLTHVKQDCASVRFTTSGNIAVCVDYWKKGTAELRRSYELWNGVFRNDTDRHTVTLNGLEAAQEYEFRIGLIPETVVRAGSTCGPQEVVLLPEVYSFKTLAAGGMTRFCAVSDTHLPFFHRRNMLESGERVLRISESDFMLHLGDIAGNLDNFDDDVLGGYAEYFNRGGRLTPLANCRGNHEHCGAERVWWNYSFAAPDGRNYGVFRSGDCCIVMLDYWWQDPDRDKIPSNLGEHFAVQKTWLKTVTETEIFRSAKYRICCNHCPPYLPDGKKDLQTAQDLQQMLVDTGAENWSLFLCGHCHQRFYRVLDCGIPVLCLGGGESVKEITFVELQTAAAGLQVHAVSGEGDTLWDFTVPPVNN